MEEGEAAGQAEERIFKGYKVGICAALFGEQHPRSQCARGKG